MSSGSCQGCARARDDGGFAVPGSVACLGCRRALPHAATARDLWVAGPPGASVGCDDRGFSLRAPVLGSVRYGLLALACALGIAWASAYGSQLMAAVSGAFAGVWLAGLRRRAIRHSWGIQEDRVWHTAAIGSLTVTRTYPARTIRAFHCAGSRANGPVRFHCGPYTVAVAELPLPADNEWLMHRLNDRLAEERRALTATRPPPGCGP